VNDLVRGRAMDPETGRIKLGWELAAGGMAGGSQVVNSSRIKWSEHAAECFAGFHKPFGNCVRIPLGPLFRLKR